MRTRVLSAVLIGLCTLLLAGCPQRTTIANINRDPGRYTGKEVTIAGQVVSSFGALGSGVFEVDDGPGRMWAFSQSYGVPGNGGKVAVTGRIDRGLHFVGGSFATKFVDTQSLL